MKKYFKLSILFFVLLMGTSLIADGQIVISSGTTLSVAAGTTLTTSGDLTNAGTLSIISTGTVDANGTFNATGGSVTFSGAGNLKLGGTVTSLGTFTEATSTVTYDGVNQSIHNLTYYNLVSSGSGTKTITDDVTVTNDLTSGGGTTLVMESTATKNGSLIVAGTSSGNITYNRHLLADKWHLVAAPVGGLSITNFITDNLSNLATSNTLYGLAVYNNESPSWVHYTNGGTSDNFTAGKGYETMRSTTPETFAFTGTVTTDDVTIPITSPPSGNPWNLVGNPYPSAIGANNDALSTKNLVAFNGSVLGASEYQAIYVWDAASSSYLTVNHSYGSAFYVAPGQGFFVYSKNASGSSFSITEAMQIHETGNIFKSGNTRYPTIKLIAGQEEGGATSTNIKYIENTTTGLDPGYDAGRFSGGNNSFAVYTHLVGDENSTVEFDIQCLPPQEYQHVIPVGINASANADIVFSTETQNLPEGVPVFLEDREAETFTRLDEEGSSYAIKTLSALDGRGRFYIHTSQSTGMDEIISPEQINVLPKPWNNSLQIKGNVGQGTHLYLYDMAGRMLMQSKLNQGDTNELQMGLINTGIYLVVIRSQEFTDSRKISWKRY